MGISLPMTFFIIVYACFLPTIFSLDVPRITKVSSTRYAGSKFKYLAIHSTSNFSVSSALRNPSIKQAPLLPIRVFMSSKSDDAVACKKLLFPLFRIFGSITTFEPYYVENRYTNEPYTCFHGAAECVGNRYQICAYNYLLKLVQDSLHVYDHTYHHNYPDFASLASSSPAPLHHPSSLSTHAYNNPHKRRNPYRVINDQFMRFLICQDQNLTLVGKAGPTHGCLVANGFSKTEATAILVCGASQQGQLLMERSMDFSRRAKVSLSCTIRVSNAMCVHDGGRWRRGCPGGGSLLGFRNLICRQYRALLAVEDGGEMGEAEEKRAGTPRGVEEEENEERRRERAELELQKGSKGQSHDADRLNHHRSRQGFSVPWACEDQDPYFSTLSEKDRSNGDIRLRQGKADVVPFGPESANRREGTQNVEGIEDDHSAHELF